jgi:hypothetical protein
MGASIVSQKITSFTYSNVEELYDQWSPTTTYGVELIPPYTNAATVLHRNFYWRSTSTGNLGNEPIDEKGNVSSEWIVVSPAHLSSILDLSSNSRCTITGEDLILEFAKNYEIQTLIVGRFMGIEIVIEYLDETDEVIETDSYNYEDEQYNNIIDDITYDYAQIQEIVNRNRLIRLKLMGEKIRLTLVRNPITDTAYISFLTGGEEYQLGNIDGSIDRTNNTVVERKLDTTRGVLFDKTIISQNYSFVFLVPRVLQPEMRRKGEEIKDKVNTFILDNRENSEFEYIITLAQLKSDSDSIGNADYINFRWAIEETT